MGLKGALLLFENIEKVKTSVFGVLLLPGTQVISRALLFLRSYLSLLFLRALSVLHYFCWSKTSYDTFISEVKYLYCATWQVQ